MLTVVAAAAIAGAVRLAIKWMSKVVVVVGDYSIIELHIRVAINSIQVIYRTEHTLSKQ